MVEKKSFSEKHPRISTLLGLVIMVAVVYIGILVIKSAFDWMSEALIKFLRELTKLDVVVIVALITGAFSIIAVCLSTIIGKVIESHQAKREYLTNQREKPYEDFVEMIYKLQMSTKQGYEYSEQEMFEDISKVSKQITLWGSKDVVDKWVKFRENAMNKDAAVDSLLLIEGIMNDMRKDLGVKRTKKGNLLSFFVNDIKESIKTR